MDATDQFSVPPSTASRPDLDWSQVRETIMMLNLAVAQIELALKESSGSVDVLTNAFTDIYGNLMAMVEEARALPDSPIKQLLETGGATVSEQMRQIIVAFQFYDRLSQRLSHVCHSLDELSGIVNEPKRLYNPFAWHALQQKIRSKYTMAEEREMFDTLLQTGDVRTALDKFVVSKHGDAGKSTDVELF